MTTAPGPSPDTADTRSADGWRRIGEELRTSWRVVLVSALVAGAAAAGLTALQQDRYVSAVTFVVQTSTGANDGETQIRTMMALVPTQVVAGDLRSAAGVETSPERISEDLDITRPPGSAVITVTYAAPSEAASRAVAEEVVSVFTSRVQQLNEPRPGEVAANYAVRPWGDGAVTTTQESPPVARNTAIGLLLGALAGVGLVVLRSRAGTAQPERGSTTAPAAGSGGPAAAVAERRGRRRAASPGSVPAGPPAVDGEPGHTTGDGSGDGQTAPEPQPGRRGS